MDKIETGKFVSRWKWIIIGASLWWILGFNLFIYHAAAFLFFCQLMQRLGQKNSGLYVPSTAVLLFFVAAIYGVSIAIHSPASQTSRIVAALYNLSFWLMGALLVVVFSNAFRMASMEDVFSAFRSLGFQIAVLTLIVFVFWLKRTDQLELQTPLFGLSKFLGGTNLVKDSLIIRPLTFDWFASSARPRLNILAPYPTASAGLIMLALFFLFTEGILKKGTQSPLWLTLMGANLLALGMTLSRMSMLALSASLLFVWFVGRKNLFIWVVAAVSLFLVLFPWLSQFTEWIMGLRGGSTSTRMDLYRYTIDQLNGSDWILGVGMKPREDIFSIPIGSHSTYVSLLYKSGIVGLGVFIVFQLVLFLRWFNIREESRSRRHYFLFWRCLGFVLISMGLWVITEDIDAPQALSFLYFSSIGLFEGFRKELLLERTRKSARKENNT